MPEMVSGIDWSERARALMGVDPHDCARIPGHSAKAHPLEFPNMLILAGRPIGRAPAPEPKP